MSTNQTILKNATLITMDAQQNQYMDGAILIEDDEIIRLGRTSDFSPDELNSPHAIDLSGRLIIPGLINTHVHTSQQLGRGLGDDVPLLTWLRERIWPYESNLAEADSEVSTLLLGLEQIRSGVTTIGESGGQHVSGMVKAIDKLGLRAALSRSTMDEGEGLPRNWQNTTDHEIQAQIDLFDAYDGQADGRIRIWFSLRTIFNNSDLLIQKTRDVAQQYNTGIMMHVAEIREENDYAMATRGAPTVTHLHKLGLLDHNLLAAHCVWLTDEEIALFAKHNVKVTHNPAAAMRVLGFASIPEMLERG
ncbi:MAG: amidohydrolase family protein, partial [Chloroflexota bacterium]